MPLREKASETKLLLGKIVSSENCRWVMFGIFLVIVILEILFFLYASITALPNSFVMMMKREGDKGSPFLIPLDVLKKPYGITLIRINILRVDINLKIRLIH